jgi:hypothetical protein
MKAKRPVKSADPVPPEQELSGKDPAFPGLGFLLDPELFSGLVRMRAAKDPGVGRLEDLRYRPGSDCTATFVFGSGEAQTWVYARALQPGEPTTASDEVERTPTALGFCRAIWREYGLAVRAFPCDDGLPSLASLAHDDTRERLLAAVLPDQPGGALSTRTVSYDPERRWLGAVEGSQGPVAALRIHAAHAFPSARWNAQGLHGGEGLKLPRILGGSREHCATAVEWAKGRPLERALFDPGLHRVELEGVGAALAELHAQDPGGLPHSPPAAAAPVVRALASTLAFILPRSAPRARRLADRLVRRLVELSLDEQLIHGSLKPSKVLLQGGGRVVLIDLDSACQGPLGRDTGNLVAHLERAAVAGEITPARARWAAEAILDGYERTASWPLRRRDLTLHTALALFELALRPFRKLVPEWADHTMAILDRAESVLRE